MLTSKGKESSLPPRKEEDRFTKQVKIREEIEEDNMTIDDEGHLESRLDGGNNLR